MSAERTLYLDSSALVKLVQEETESPALEALVARGGTHVASVLVRAEVPRAARRGDPSAPARAQTVLDELDLIDLDEDLLAQSATLGDAGLRTLDAIHLASALTLRDELDAMVTYDHRMAEAARDLGIAVESPR